MRRQRGLGLIELAIYAVILIAVVGALYAAWVGFKRWVAAPYVEEQRVADEKLWKAEKQRADDAERDRDTAKANYGTLKDSCDKQSGEIEKWKGVAKSNSDAYRAEVERRKKSEVSTVGYIARKQAEAADQTQAARDKAVACEQRLIKLEKSADEALRMRRAPAIAK